MGTRVRVAAVQMTSVPFEVDKNLFKAELLVQQAAKAGAEIIVLPELFNSGYAYDPRNFEAAEFISGRSGRWFRETAKRLGVFLAGSIIEKDNDRYFDTLVLSTPDGRLASYRKLYLALQEKCFFSPGDYPLILDTDLGRIGTGICADLLYRDVWERYRGKVDLLIISSAWPDFTSGKFPLRWSFLNRRITEMTSTLPKRLSASLGVPVVYANLCGPFDSTLPFLYFRPVGARFAGRSSIHDPGGKRLHWLETEEGIVISSVLMNRGSHPGENVESGSQEADYWVEPSVRFSAWFDRTFLGLPCRMYQWFKRPR